MQQDPGGRQHIGRNGMCDTTESDATRGDEAFAVSHDSRKNFVAQSLSSLTTISGSDASGRRVVAGLFC